MECCLGAEPKRWTSPAFSSVPTGHPGTDWQSIATLHWAAPDGMPTWTKVMPSWTSNIASMMPGPASVVRTVPLPVAWRQLAPGKKQIAGSWC